MMHPSTQFPDREVMEYDVVIVGAGPAGLSCSLRLKQLDPSLSVVVVEKGPRVGAHILSGAVIDPVGLDYLLPTWREDPTCPLQQKVTEDHFRILGPQGDIRIPHFLLPPLMENQGNFVGSLGRLTQWLSEKAEALGVEIYPSIAASELLYHAQGAVRGIATGDMGIRKNGEKSANYTRGMELWGKYTILAEGARGSLAQQAISHFRLDATCEPQKFGIGFKEIWKIDPAKHRPGLVQHTLGWPLDNQTGGGSFLYHVEDSLVSLGFVVHLNYKNPTLSPFDTFQHLKTHPLFANMLEGGKRLSYGARALTEGGFQSVPKLVFPGGALVGCAAGFVNVPRIKGSHHAILSGCLLAEQLVPALQQGRALDELMEYETHWRESLIGQDLKKVRNIKPLWSKFGTMFGVLLGGLEMWMQSLFNVSLFGTLSHDGPDSASLKPLSQVKRLTYPAPDGKLTFDRLSSLSLANVHHEEDQPIHLHLQDPDLPIQQNLPLYGEPAQLYCPAGVYEIVEEQFVINAQNCIHCKTCDIKDPARNITWVPPEGGGGPNYGNM